MALPFRTTRRIEFADTDMAGIAHFTSFFRYMEEAEHAFLRSLGLSVMMHDPEGQISWPRVNATCDFKAPVWFEQVLDVELSIARRGRSSITYQFTFTCEDRLIAEGQITAVCCRIIAGQPPASIPLPDNFAGIQEHE